MYEKERKQQKIDTFTNREHTFYIERKTNNKKIKKMESRFSDLIESSKISSENHDLFDCIGNQSKNGKFIFIFEFFQRIINSLTLFT